MTAARQGTAEWHDARRSAVSSTDLGVILGLNPWKSEWELAAEKSGELEPASSTLPMRIGLALEPLIRDEYERQTGERLRRIRTLVTHPSIPWAVASPDYRVVGRPWLVEAKWSLSSRWSDGLPQDVEAQVQWALGVTGRQHADVAALLGSELRILPVEYDAELFGGLVDVAEDFRARMSAGGPFSQTAASLKRRYPTDSGKTVVADPDTAAAVATLVNVRGRLRALEEDRDRLEVLIKSAMADAAVLDVPGYRVTWKQTRPIETVDWKSLGTGLLADRPDRETILGIYTAAQPGRRPLLVRAVAELEGSE